MLDDGLEQALTQVNMLQISRKSISSNAITTHESFHKSISSFQAVEQMALSSPTPNAGQLLRRAEHMVASQGSREECRQCHVITPSSCKDHSQCWTMVLIKP